MKRVKGTKCRKYLANGDFFFPLIPFVRKDVNLKEVSADTTDLTQYKSEGIRLGMC